MTQIHAGFNVIAIFVFLRTGDPATLILGAPIGTHCIRERLFGFSLTAALLFHGHAATGI
jgi:hypothetical protein